MTLNWSTSYATSCTASGGFGGWAGSTIALPSGSQSVPGSYPGASTFYLVCEDTSGTTDTKSTTVTVGSGSTSRTNPPPPTTGDFSITSFVSSAATVLPNQSFTLSWTTVNAASCKGLDGAGGWAQPLNVSSSMDIALSVDKTYTFTLRCEDASGNALSTTIDVTVSSSSSSTITQDCSPSTSLSNTASSLEWSEWWANNDEYGAGVAHVFPSPLNSTRAYLDVGECGYNYISFDTGDASGYGAFSLLTLTSSDGLRMGALSSVPGDFEVAAECKQLWGLDGWIAYTTTEEPTGASSMCRLEKGRTYYLNFTFTNGTDASTSSCVSPITRANGDLHCEILIQSKFTPDS